MQVSKGKQTYNVSVHEVLDAYKTSREGLSDAEAKKRLLEFGRNELTSHRSPLWRRIIEPFASYFVIVIIIAAIISAIERKWFETLIISIIVVVNAIIYYFQQFSVSRVLKTLREQDRQFVIAMRDGDEEKIDSELLVPGDIIYVSEGMKVPADGRLIEANNVQADESMLTGESLPVHKRADAIAGTKQIYDQANMMFKGTFISSGSGLLLITGTGNATELGAINTLAAEAQEGKTPIETKIDDLTKKLLYGIAVATAAVFALAMYRGIEIDEAIAYTLSILVSAVPEGLPVAMTLVLLFSARRMARQKALVKHIASMETMGAITLIATDKTGTITQNKLSVADMYTAHTSKKTFHEAIRASLNGDIDSSEDPLDVILHQEVKQVRIPREWKKVKEFPFDQKLRMSGVVWQHAKGYSLYVKGAPEQILHHCRNNTLLDEAKSQLKEFTSRGYRTIGFAQKDSKTLPEKLDARKLSDMHFDGFVGLSDQLRPGVKGAIAQAHQAGIKVVMLTGDHIETAGYIAREVGIAKNQHQVSDSSVLASKDPEAIRKALRSTTVFGRVLPEHKYSLLKALKGHEITTMTGDGVNDIPALVEADAGLAMGSGTDAAKDASDIVLVNSNFRTIMNAVRVGRTVLANIRKMVVYLVGTNSGEILIMLLALLFGLPLPLTAVMVLWINLVTDGVSVIPLGLSSPEEHHMKLPPKDPRAPLLEGYMLVRSILLAVIMATTVLYVFTQMLHHGEAYARTAAFLSLIVIQWANAFNMNFEFRSWAYNFVRPNWKLVVAIGVSMAVNILIFTTSLKQYFGLETLKPVDALLAIVMPTVVTLVLCDVHKLLSNALIRRKRRASASASAALHTKM